MPQCYKLHSYIMYNMYIYVWPYFVATITLTWLPVLQGTRKHDRQIN